MEGFTHPSDSDRELDDLRRRAYGRDPDIGVDPQALARLRELEEAHRSGVPGRVDASTSESATGTDAPAPITGTSAVDQEGQEQPKSRTDAPRRKATVRLRFWTLSLVQRATATWRSRLVWGAGALVVAGGIVATVLLIFTRPDATLHLTGAESDRQVRRLVIVESPWLEIDASTLRAYGSYLGLEIWSGVNAFDSPCLVAVHRANNTLSESRCAPSEADLIMDVSSSGDGFDGFEGRPGDGIIRFMLRGNSVDAYVYLLPEGD